MAYRLLSRFLGRKLWTKGSCSYPSCFVAENSRIPITTSVMMVFYGMCHLLKTGCAIYTRQIVAYESSRTLYQRVSCNNKFQIMQHLQTATHRNAANKNPRSKQPYQQHFLQAEVETIIESVLRLLSTGKTLLSSDESEENESVEKRDPALDRTRQIPVETSIQYLRSEAYKLSYGSDPIWTLYRRNFKGPRQPRFTRKTCIRKGVISTGNPCPICRDEYLVLHNENVQLLKQFISPHTGEVLSFLKTGLCQKRHKELLVAIEKARDHGYLTYDVPFREYDYSLYYKN